MEEKATCSCLYCRLEKGPTRCTNCHRILPRPVVQRKRGKMPMTVKYDKRQLPQRIYGTSCDYVLKNGTYTRVNIKNTKKPIAVAKKNTKKAAGKIVAKGAGKKIVNTRKNAVKKVIESNTNKKRFRVKSTQTPSSFLKNKKIEEKKKHMLQIKALKKSIKQNASVTLNKKSLKKFGANYRVGLRQDDNGAALSRQRNQFCLTQNEMVAPNVNDFEKMEIVEDSGPTSSKKIKNTNFGGFKFFKSQSTVTGSTIDSTENSIELSGSDDTLQGVSQHNVMVPAQANADMNTQKMSVTPLISSEIKGFSAFKNNLQSASSNQFSFGSHGVFLERGDCSMTSQDIVQITEDSKMESEQQLNDTSSTVSNDAMQAEFYFCSPNIVRRRTPEDEMDQD